mgnify:CR=1 FL=1
MSITPMPWPEHGGPDGGPAILHDFSTNANPLPLPEALVNYLALIGWSPGNDEELLPLDDSFAKEVAKG